jgi:hypothetical protein
MPGCKSIKSERLQAMHLHAQASAPSHSWAIIEMMSVVTCVVAASKSTLFSA